MLRTATKLNISRRLSSHPQFKSYSRAFYSTTFSKYPFLERLGLKEDQLHGCYYGEGWKANGPTFESRNPSTGEVIAHVTSASEQDTQNAIEAAKKGFNIWKNVPAPKRGEIIRQVGEKLRHHIDDIGAVISLEVGKIKAEGVGEVQEFVDICDYAVGLSRMLNGKVIPSERQDHALFEQYNPMGVTGIISAFNFPCAVYGWNFAISAVVGNSVLWKGAQSVPLTTLAVGRLIAEVFEENNMPGSVASTLIGGPNVGEAMAKDSRIPLVSFTGSTKVGSHVQQIVRQRFGQTILELGGNNACIVHHDADLKLALRAVLFGAVGTAGQRCTSTRRLLIHENVYDQFLEQLLKSYKTVTIGDVFEDSNVLCGPLHSTAQVEAYKKTIEQAKQQGGKVLCGGNVLDRPGNFVEPTVIAIDPHAEVAQHECFAPILYVMKYSDIQSAFDINNQTGYGLSSSLFTKSHENLFRWMGPSGSSAGIVNVNIGTSGAEIGGGFGGNDLSGHGREAGSDSWKHYTRVSTCTVNYGKELPLAQGIKFGDE